jgi:hypothetical protein
MIQLFDLQVESLIPDGIQFLWHSAGPFFYFAYLDGDVRIWRATFIFCDQSLGANHWISIVEHGENGIEYTE